MGKPTDTTNTATAQALTTPSGYELTKEMLDILDHTQHRATRGLYCGGSEAMDKLVDMGLMEYRGTVSWCPDKYYSITRYGSDALYLHNDKDGCK